jgi:hypothetical protein
VDDRFFSPYDAWKKQRTTTLTLDHPEDHESDWITKNAASWCLFDRLLSV